MKSALATLALGLALASAAGFPAERKAGAERDKRVRFAAWDDVNVIAHGLLQLGQGLKEHVDKTKVQMRDVLAKIKVHEGAVAELAAESRRRRAEGEAVLARARGLEDGEARLLNVTAELRERTDEMRGDGAALRARLSRLEERLPEGAANGSGNGIQRILEAQNRRMDELTARLKLQQEKLDKQNVRIRSLQSQIQQSRQRPFSNTEGFATSGGAEQRDSPVAMASDCHELFLRGETASGVFSVRPHDAEAFPVFCEMAADGGWTVVQKRQDGSVDFDRLWSAYEKGFGSVDGEFWLGLEKIHAIAKDADYVLKIQLSDWGDDSASVRLPFRLGGAETGYSLRVREAGAFSPLESSLGPDAASGLPFSTRDRDNDRKKESNCARHLSGGWWFSNCGRSNLNGRFFRSPPPKQRHQRKQGIFWKTWRGRYYPLKSSVMMIAPAAIRSES
ncbi:angiopoietin-related protein 4 [Hippocampus comes]|uniref:Angiopoietin-like 4 n=1 Tax=Hippocampus comes TaxID=109280 RepID=A0A3Q2YQJ5_HIPCM|nr:PREDICTED: angiopoietin-related protein 4 [Hippocampus comes]